jgi:hypothetical protein
VQTGLDLIDLARSEQHPRRDAANPNHLGPDNVHVGKSRGKRHGLGKPVLGGAAGAICLQVGMQYKGTHRLGTPVARIAASGADDIVIVFAWVDAQSSPS